MLIESGFPLDEKTNLGHTALIMCASISGNNQICTKLVKAGANVNIISNDGVSALSEAIIHEN